MEQSNSNARSFRLKVIFAVVFAPLLAWGAINTFDQLRANKLNVDNVQVDGNTLSTTNTNGDLTIDLPGTGKIILADLTGSAALYLDGSNKIQSEAQLAPVRGGTGMDSSGSTGVAKVSAGTWSVASVVNADISASAAIAYSKLNLTGAILNADLAGSIARSKIASGSNSHVVINDGSGNLSSEATLAKSRGGAGADVSSVTFPSSGTIQAGTPNQYGVMVSGSGSTYSVIAPDASTTKVLTSGGSSAAPTWADVPSAPSSPQELSNVGLDTSVSSNALTIALKQADGSTDCSSGGSACKIGFNNGTGGYSQVSVTSSLSLTISSGSTLGTASGIAHYIYVYAVNNSGTVLLAASLSTFDEGKVWGTTAEGGAGGADSFSLLYASSAVSNKAIRMIGKILITEATAGTWASDSTSIFLVPFKTNWPHCHYTNAAGTAVTVSGTLTYSPFATKVHDTHNMMTTGTGTVTVPEAGVYHITCHLTPTTSAGSNATIVDGFIVTSTSNNTWYRMPNSPANSTLTSMTMTKTLYLPLGATVRCAFTPTFGGGSGQPVYLWTDNQTNQISVTKIGEYQ